MKTVEEMIKRVRRETRNANVGPYTAGGSIADIEFIDQLQDGQEMCIELLSGVFAPLFERTKIYTIDTTVADYEILALPSDILMGTRICLVEFSYTGKEADYVNLPPVDIRERYTGTSYARSALGYILSGNSLILSERPNRNNSTIRLTYEIALPRLDIVKASVLTGNRSGTDFTGTFTTPTTIDTDGDGVTDASEWDVGDTVTVMSKPQNTMLIQDGTLSAYDYGAGTFTIDLTNATYVAATVDAATATDLRLIEGGRTNLCELPDACEKYIINWAIYAIKGRDSSRLARSFGEKLQVIEQSLMKNYLQASKDWASVPEGDY